MLLNPALLTGLFGIGEKLIDHWFPDADEADRRKADLLQFLQEADLAKFMGAVSVIQAEAKSEHWIVAAWRPITMLTFVFIIANNYILYPYLSLFIDNAPMLEIPENMWELIKIGLGGYVVSRGVEKTMEIYKGSNNG